MKKLILLLSTLLLLYGESVEIKDFKTDIFSQNSSSLKKIKLDLVFDINSTTPTPTYIIKDGLNIVVSSFFIESLFTSKTKENFKELLKKYLKQKHSVVVNNIYIEDMQIVDQVSLEEIKDMIKSHENNKSK